MSRGAVGGSMCIVPIVMVTIWFFCNFSLESVLLCLYICKQCSLTNFVGNFVCKVSHEVNYEMIEFLVVWIEVILALECWTCSHIFHTQKSPDIVAIRLASWPCFLFWSLFCLMILHI